MYTAEFLGTHNLNEHASPPRAPVCVVQSTWSTKDTDSSLDIDESNANQAHITQLIRVGAPPKAVPSATLAGVAMGVHIPFVFTCALVSIVRLGLVPFRIYAFSRFFVKSASMIPISMCVPNFPTEQKWVRWLPMYVLANQNRSFFISLIFSHSLFRLLDPGLQQV